MRTNYKMDMIKQMGARESIYELDRDSVMPMGSVYEKGNMDNRFKQDFGMSEVSASKVIQEIAKDGKDKWNHEFEKEETSEFRDFTPGFKKKEKRTMKDDKDELIVSAFHRIMQNEWLEVVK
jgi:hypothetical protein